VKFDIAAFLGFLGLALLPALGITTFLVASEVRHGRVELRSRTAACLHWIAVVLAWVPALSLAGFAALVIHERFEVGTWPTSDVPLTFGPNGFEGGPVHLRGGPARVILGLLVALGLPSLLVVPPLFALARAGERPIEKLTVRTYYLAWTALVLLAAIDPGELFSWAFGD